MPKTRRRRRAEKKSVIPAVPAFPTFTLPTEVRSALDKLLPALRTTPLGVVVIAGLTFWQLQSLPASLVSSIPMVSYIALVFGVAITACFDRGRAFFLLITLFLSQVGMFVYVPAHLDRAFALQGMYLITCILLPLNFLFFASIAERRILSPKGKRCLLVLAVQLVMVFGMILSGDPDFFRMLAKHFIPAGALPFTTAMPDLAVLMLVVAGAGILAKRGAKHNHFKWAAFCALGAAAIALHFYNEVILRALFAAVAAAILIVAVIQDYYFKAYLDELTGLPSRRSLNEDMTGLDGDYVIAMLDVDFFKKFNDTYGHDAGDDVLRFIARIMKDFKQGKAFRYGGEEFTILFPGKNLGEAIPALDDLREEIAKSSFVLRGEGKNAGKRLNVTVSIGAAETGSKRNGPDEVIKAADTALYRAKENGRNCVSK